MRFNQMTSLFMAVMVLGAGFIALCPANGCCDFDAHFITEPCESHECPRGNKSPSCTQGECEHGLCSDASIINGYPVTQQNHCVFLSSTPLSVLDRLFRQECRGRSLLSKSGFSAYSLQRTTVLRI